MSPYRAPAVIVRSGDPRVELWRRLAAGTDEGIGLSWKLHEGQLELRELVGTVVRREILGRLVTLRCARRYGKTRYFVVDAFEYGTKKKDRPARLRYAAPTGEDAQDILDEHCEEILADCPRDLMPKWNAQKMMWTFHDGSRLKLVGCDDKRKCNRLRGRSLDRGWVDEGGSIPDLQYLIKDILMPQTLTTGGIILMGSTPPESPAHPCADYFRAAEAKGRGFHRDIYAAPHITDQARVDLMVETIPSFTPDEARDYVARREHPTYEVRTIEGETNADGTPKTESASELVGLSSWLREYAARIAVDSVRAVLPEFSRLRDAVVREVERPDFFHTYTALDVGFNDMSHACIGYWNFDIGKLVIEDEVAMNRSTSAEIDTAIMAKEKTLYGQRRMPIDHPPGAPLHRPIARVVDTTDQTIADLRIANGNAWQKARNDDLEATVNSLRVGIARGKVLIHPRCRVLIAHCEAAVWNSQRTKFERPEGADGENGEGIPFGHFDGVASLMYLWRHVAPNLNPYPDGYHDRHIPRDSQFRRKPIEDRRERAKLMKLVRR